MTTMYGARGMPRKIVPDVLREQTALRLEERVVLDPEVQELTAVRLLADTVELDLLRHEAVSPELRRLEA